MTSRVRTVTPSAFSRTPIKRYQAGCLECRWFGKRWRKFQSALDESERHDIKEHSEEKS